VPIEGVVNALRRIHAALVMGGVLIDTQPISPRPAVETSAGRLGTLDMRDWCKIINAVDQRVAQTIEEGLWANEGEHRYVVTDTFGSGGELVDTVNEWQGTRISEGLSRRTRVAAGQACVHQDVRLRVLRRCPAGSSVPGRRGPRSRFRADHPSLSLLGVEVIG
jgi:hypothetical protein